VNALRKSLPSLRIFLLWFPIVLILGCAKSVAPPGGPIDRTPPEMMTVSPKSGSVSVPLDSRVIIKFSERIDPATVDNALFISPEPEEPPKIKVKSDQVEIIPREDLKPDRTYIITLGTALKDAHSVNLAQSATIAFSTGATIDSGSVAGIVYRDGKAAPGISLALFDQDPGSAIIPIDSIVPDYQTQSGEGGVYKLNYLPPDSFYLVAYDDKNKNRRVDFGREMIGLPFVMARITTAEPWQTGLDMQMHASDTSRVGFRTVSMNSDGLVKIRLTQPLDRPQTETLFATLAIRPSADTLISVDIDQYIPLTKYPASDFLVLTGPLTPDSTYNLSFDRASLYPAIKDTLRVITYGFKATSDEDKTSPALLDFAPPAQAVNVNPDSQFVLRFSEPIAITTADPWVWLTTAANDTLPIPMTAVDRFDYSGRPANGLAYGQDYSWFILGSLVRDRAGNLLSDSIVSYAFSTIGQDTLGSMSGEIRLEHAADSLFPIMMTFNPARDGVRASTRIAPGIDSFRVELLPGNYTISAFVDRNDNGTYDYGSLRPYRLAEPFTAQSDTIRVRTRFESAGVIVEF
jgi:hypothetical protein